MEEAARQRDLDKRAARAQQQREEEDRARTASLLDQQNFDAMVARRQEEEEEAQRASQMQTESSTTVIVKNLVDGTTPEDVQAAFADFGVILNCKVLETNGDVLTMQVEFGKRSDAETACGKLE